MTDQTTLEHPNGKVQGSDMGMSPRIATMTVFIIGFCLLVNAFLNFSNFQKSYTDMVRSRFVVVAKDIKQTTEYGLGLGLTLPEMRTLQSIVVETESKDDDVKRVMIFNAEGNSVYDSTQKLVGTKVSEDWLSKDQKNKADTIWSSVDDMAYYLGLPLYNSFNAKVGTLVIGYSKTKIDDKLREMIISLGVVLIVILAGFAVIIFVGVYWFNRKLSNNLKSMEASMQNVLDNGAISPGNGAESEIEKDFAVFQEESVNLLSRLNGAKRALDELEKMSGRTV